MSNYQKQNIFSVPLKNIFNVPLQKKIYIQRPIRTKLECENGILSNSPQKKKLIHLLISDKPRLAAALLIQTQESESHRAYT